jgi:Flp pilus assembly protein TadG
MHLIPATLGSSRRGAVSLLFAIALIPMLIMVGLAVDYGLYSQAESQLDMAADAAAMHAARIAAQLLQHNDPACQTKAVQAGKAWFASQLGVMPQAKTINLPVVTVSCLASNTSVTAKVDYTGIITANFGNLVPATWPGRPNWNIGGTATAVISNPTYIEVLMLLDNSSSMMIASTPDEIAKMQALTPCSEQSKTMGQGFDSSYSWAYTPVGGTYTTNPPQSAFSTTPAPANKSLMVPYGFGTFVYPASDGHAPTTTAEIVPPLSNSAAGGAVKGQCDARFTGPAKECSYPGYILNPANFPANGVSKTGQCLNGQGGPGNILNADNYSPPAGYSVTATQNMPQAPCAFACHNDAGGNDYWGLAETQSPKIQLRYDLLQDAAGNVIQTMSKSQSASRLSVGVYQFNAPLTANAQPNGINQVYPAAASSGSFAASEAGPVTDQAQTLTKTVLPPVTHDNPDTNFENAMKLLTGFVTPSGAGNYPAAPKKNLFIVTDGMDDYFSDPATQAGRTQGAINPAACDQLKTEGFTIYVLYTPYYPLANPFYLENDKAYVENISAKPPLTTIEYAMYQCASPNDFYQATDDPTSIDKALQTMLAAALGSAGRLKN